MSVDWNKIWRRGMRHYPHVLVVVKDLEDVDEILLGCAVVEMNLNEDLKRRL